MGRMKVYGGSWDLPGVQDMKNPFSPFLTECEMEDFGPTPESNLDPRPIASGVVQNNRKATTAPKEVTPDKDVPVPNTDTPPSAK